MFECYCLITIQTQNFIPYYGHATMYTYICILYNKIWTNIFNQKRMVNKIYDLIFS